MEETLVVYFTPESGLPNKEIPASQKANHERIFKDKIQEILPVGYVKPAKKNYSDYKDKRIAELVTENIQLKAKIKELSAVDVTAKLATKQGELLNELSPIKKRGPKPKA